MFLVNFLKRLVYRATPSQALSIGQLMEFGRTQARMIPPADRLDELRNCAGHRGVLYAGFADELLRLITPMERGVFMAEVATRCSGNVKALVTRPVVQRAAS